MSGSSCSTPPEPVADNPLNSRAWWRGDGVQGKSTIVINLSTQRLQYYKGGQLVGVSPISSGRESNGTVTGTYRIIEKDMDHRSSLFGAYADKAGNLVQEDVDTRTDALPNGAKFIGASMRYFMRIVGGIGMHEGYLPGYPASHGCIRLPTKMAAIFFRETPEGTPVQIIGEGSLAANESAIPVGVEEIVDVPAVKTATRAAAKIESSPAAQVAASKVPEQLTVRRAIVQGPKSAGFGSMFNWFRKPPPGTTIYLSQ
ncbi:MAG: L,D-transpeptidase family protein [Prosthecobacter sp.]